MIDPKFTEKIARWLDSDHKSSEAIAQGAMLLLQLNRDRSMYQRIMRRPQRELSFLEYKLRRFLQMRQDGKTVRDVIQIDNDITPELGAVIKADALMSDAGKLPVPQPPEKDGGNDMYVRKGIRPDHDRLPAEIQAIWAKNAERWKKIKEAFETCKSLTEPCDRYEYLKVLKDTWYKYKQEMARYDDYRLTADAATVPDVTPSGAALTPEQEKELKNADSYISKNLPQMQQLVAAAKEEDFNEAQQKQLESLRSRIQQRVDILLKYGRTLTDERREQLIACDIRVVAVSDSDNSDKTADNEQGNESE
mgnify:CR=1 FL=1